MRVPGRISPRKAAAMLGVHYETVIRWCQAAVAGESSRLHDVEQHITGYYWISAEEIRALRRSFPKNGKKK